MNVLNIFGDQQIAHDVFRETGMVRVQFSELNNSPRDMLNVYARQYLGLAETHNVLAALTNVDTDYLEPDAKSLYLFSKRTYKTFLQMSIRECSKSDSEDAVTSCWEELYTTNNKVAAASSLPVLSLEDINLFNAIDTSVYANELPADVTHMLHVDTCIKRKGCIPVTISEFLLYLPDDFK